MRILADANIPLVEELFRQFGDVVALPSETIDASGVRDADILLVRSVTRVDEALLADSAVRFVGTATIGSDHVDQGYLASRGIGFAHAPGSNADSVVEYVLAALLAAFAASGQQIRGLTVGVVGCGAIGSRLAARLPAFGANVLRNDPPLARASGGAGFVSLPHLLASADVVTVHTPLTLTGPDATQHLIGARMLGTMRRGSWIVNTSRGPVVDNSALREALLAGHLGGAILDVWENEPEPDLSLLAQCALATPHIAGYSFDGKIQGAVMLAAALAEFLGLPATGNVVDHLSSGDLAALAVPPAGENETAWLDALTRQAYDIRSDDAAMRALLALPAHEHAAHFRNLRATYSVRRAFPWHRPAEPVPAEHSQAVQDGLRIGTA